MGEGAGQDLVHGSEGERIEAGGGGFEDLDAGEQRHLEQDSGELHFAVEFSRDYAGNFDVAVEQVIKFAGAGFADDGVDGAAVHEEAEIGAVHGSEVDGVGTAHGGAHGNAHAVELGANEGGEAGLDGVGRGAVVEEGDVFAEDIDAEAGAGFAAHQDAIAGDEVFIGFGFDVDGVVAVLNEEVDLILDVVGDGGFKGDGKPFAAWSRVSERIAWRVGRGEDGAVSAEEG